MDQIKKIIVGIKRDLNNCIDEQRLQSALKNHPTRMKILGVKVPDERKIIKQYLPEIKKLQDNEVIKLAKILTKTKIFECQNIAYKLFEKNKSLLKSLSEEDVEELRINQDNWVTVDSYSVYISGGAWREGVISDRIIEDWARSADVWTRRTAVVSTVALNQKAHGGKGDTARTIKICRMIVSDKTDLIAKAQSWALRVLSQVDQTAVENYLTQFDDVLPARVKKETWSKIEIGRKF